MMNPAKLNFLTAAIFVGTLVVGWVVLQMKNLQNQMPKNRVRDHLHTMLELNPVLNKPDEDLDADKALFEKYQETGSALSAWFVARQTRLKTVIGPKFMTFVFVVLGLSVLVDGLLMLALPLQNWWAPLLLVIAPLLVLTFCYRWIVGRFRKHFLAQFPEALDLIIRAVRAGVPANQAISAAGKEFTEPLRTEFTLMGDGLRLGIDLKDVLEESVKRIDVPEFSFFSVCLLLQRETGGQLTETLENLAQIIRARREMGMKARALTGETRAASKIIAGIPFFVVVALWFLNHDYIITLFNTPGGLFMLKIALVLIGIGLMIINHLSNLKV